MVYMYSPGMYILKYKFKEKISAFFYYLQQRPDDNYKKLGT